MRRLSFSLILFLACARYVADPWGHLPPARHVRLHPLFTNHMVLQRERPIPIWGTAEPGGKVTLRCEKEIVTVPVRPDGSWKACLKPRPAGGPLTIQIIGDSTQILKDVLVGDVWICSGQSNMEFPVKSARNGEQEVAQADFPNLRLFTVEKATSETPQTSLVSSGWQVCTPATVQDFSAVGYFFGRDLILHHPNVPIGLIHTSWGGTPAEAWTSARSLKLHPDFQERILQLERSLESALPDTRPRTIAEWSERVNRLDRGKGVWEDPNLDETGWQPIEVPGLWESGPVGMYDGVVWFRKRVRVPENWRGRSLTLSLGPIDDLDSTYVNGVFVGSIAIYNAPRIYTIPPHLTRLPELQITVRVLDWMGGGGFWGKSASLNLQAEKDSLPLSGTWLYRIGVPPEEVPTRADQNSPTTLFNAMIHPLIPYAIRGVIWYQGESNASLAYQYRTLFPLLIQDWRSYWGQGDFPFYFVQLANYRESPKAPSESDWAELREAQLLTLSVLPNTGMACAIDIGEADDIHPKNKQDVGRRLALIARHHVYGENIPYSGPIFRKMEKEGSRIRLFFDHTGGGLRTADGGPLVGFAVAGSDRRFVWAEAQIDGETVLVSSSEVADPVSVRYGWADNPFCNLINGAGLPASPFRTDDWPGITKRR